jgi:hypothetical protein
MKLCQSSYTTRAKAAGVCLGHRALPLCFGNRESCRGRSQAIAHGRAAIRLFHSQNTLVVDHDYYYYYYSIITMGWCWTPDKIGVFEVANQCARFAPASGRPQASSSRSTKAYGERPLH